MTKQDVIRQIVARTESDELTSRLVLESFFELVKSALSQGDSVHVSKFGTFKPKQQAGKKVRNITRNVSIELAARVVPCFRPSSEFKDQVRAQPVLTEPKRTKKRRG